MEPKKTATAHSDKVVDPAGVPGRYVGVPSHGMRGHLVYRPDTKRVVMATSVRFTNAANNEVPAQGPAQSRNSEFHLPPGEQDQDMGPQDGASASRKTPGSEGSEDNASAPRASRRVSFSNDVTRSESYLYDGESKKTQDGESKGPEKK